MSDEKKLFFDEAQITMPVDHVTDTGHAVKVRLVEETDARFVRVECLDANCGWWNDLV